MKNSLAAMSSTLLSGLANVVLQLLAAALLSTRDYANFALAASTILFVVGLSRSLVGHTDLIRGEREIDRGVAAAAYVLALACGAIGLGIALTGVIAWGDTASIIAVSVLLSPLFVLQDSARFRAFRVQRAQWAFASDLVVLTLAVVLFLSLAERGSTPFGLLLVWGGAVAAGFAIVVRPLHYVARLGLWPAWWRSNKDLVVPGGLEYLLKTTAPYLLNWVILFMGGAGALAGYRIVQLVFGTLGNLAQGMSAYEIPQVSAGPTKRNVSVLINRNAMILAVPAIALYASLRFLPNEFGVSLFGDSWHGVSSFLLAGAVHGFINAISVANFQVLRILGEARYSLRVRTVTVAVLPIASALGGITFGAVGIAWSLAAVASLGYLLRLVRLRTKLQTIGGVSDHIEPLSPTGEGKVPLQRGR